VFKLEPDKKLPDETSKADEPLNVEPEKKPGEPTSESKPTEPSKEEPVKTEDPQKAIQKHADLRKKAEEDAEVARKEAEIAKKAAEESETKLANLRKEKAEIQIKNRIQNSNLPESMKEKALKDPVKWLVAQNTDKVPEKPTWDDIDTLINTELDGTVTGYETDFGRKPSPKSTFIDLDNAPASAPGKEISRSKLAGMSPYEIAKLPTEVVEEMKKKEASNN